MRGEGERERERERRDGKKKRGRSTIEERDQRGGDHTIMLQWTSSGEAGLQQIR
jgi:hypothetical protein